LIPANPRFIACRASLREARVALFGIPFEGTLASFDGKDWPATRAAFATPSGFSAGGTWIDLSSTGLSQVGFIRLSMPVNTDTAVDVFHIDAISIATAATGAPIPEPAAALIFVTAGLLALHRRRTR